MANVKDLIGREFGRLTVLSRTGIPEGVKSQRAYWLCKCECGTVKVCSSKTLLNGSTKSCGCYGIESRITHGMTKTPIYKVWHGMKCRCHSTGSADYYNYGARGIEVCLDWRANFEAFRDWAIGNGWEKGLQVDRIDNDLGYTPENCRIVTQHQNNMNRRPLAGSSSKYKGVTWDKKNNKWKAGIKLNKKLYNLGRLTSESEAAIAYNVKAVELHGEFAYLNVIEIEKVADGRQDKAKE